jgi:NADP-dependent 3-hydroxy acid dehydrogenase YdfG
MPRRDLRDQVFAITGASSGIGAATAVEAAKAGMHLALAARRTDKLEEVAKQIEGLGRQALRVACDVDKDEDVKAFIAQAHRHFGRLDAVFANAGYGVYAPIAQTSPHVQAITDAQLRAMFETNFYGTMRVIREAMPILLAQGRGHLLICSSAASKVGPPFYGAYAATKAAQECVASALRAELTGKREIFVTTVHPIGTKTEFSQRVRDEMGADAARMKSNTPDMFRQPVERVALSIVRCMRKSHPEPEVWPHLPTRFMLALIDAFPRLGEWGLKRHYKRLRSK